jgi:arylsulfatase
MMKTNHGLLRHLAWLGCVSLGITAQVQGQEGTPQRPPNIVFFMADDLGYGEVGAFGQELIPTPNIDSLARDGMIFTNHYSGSPVCAPSRCVLLTGLHTGHAQVRNNWENGGWGEDQPEGQWPLATDTATLARRLQASGYATGGVGKWGLGGPGTTGAPEKQGFDHFCGYLCQRIAHNHYPTHLWCDGERMDLLGNKWFDAHQKLKDPLDTEAEYWERYNGALYAHDVMLVDAVSFVRDHRDEPFFLYYASPIPHAALQAPPQDLDAFPREWDEKPYLGQKGYLPHPRPRAAYAAMVAHLDREVGRVLATLDELDLRDNTIVVFTSDNGPTFNGGTDSTFFKSAAGMRGLKCSVYEGGLKVPTLVRWPGHIEAGRSSDLISSFQDWMPTLLEVAGTECPQGLDGISLVPTLEGKGEQAEHEALYFEYGGQQALRAGRWKAVRRKLHKGNLETELYDLEADPAEAKNLARSRPEVLARMVALLESSRTPSKQFPLPGIDKPANNKK